jgi:hypothetical protein
MAMLNNQRVHDKSIPYSIYQARRCVRLTNHRRQELLLDEAKLAGASRNVFADMLPSGYVKIAIEMASYSGVSHQKW